MGSNAEYAGAAIALVLAVVCGVLGAYRLASQTVMGSSILTTLAVLAVAILRDRVTRGAADREMRNAASDSRDILANLPSIAEDGRKMARQNVIHEIGLFQGQYGFDRVVLLAEEGCDFVPQAGVHCAINFPHKKLHRIADPVLSGGEVGLAGEVERRVGAKPR